MSEITGLLRSKFSLMGPYLPNEIFLSIKFIKYGLETTQVVISTYASSAKFERVVLNQAKLQFSSYQKEKKN